METQCDGKEDMQTLHGSCLPVDSVEYMESGMYAWRICSYNTLSCLVAVSSY